ncbi:MAG: CotH kinase family protein [Planctomycetota bacterium]|jgi:hypothetical protein
MKNVLTKAPVVAIVAILLCISSAQAQFNEPNWPEIFEPNQLLTFYLTMDPCDWAFIVREVSPTLDPKTYTELPAMLWAEGETAVSVAVRKKSGDMIPEPGYTIPGDANLIDPNKVKISLKIDINQYYPEDPNAVTEWHGQKKFSLENGGLAPDSVLSEGISCNLHRMASAPEGYGYDNWRGNWVKVYVNGVYRGVYANIEQIDKQFLKHRDLFVDHNSWLYKSWGSGSLALKVGDSTYPYSPALNALCYRPFPCLDELSPIYIGGNLCATPAPDDPNLVADMNQWVNMKAMLALGAVNTYMANHDALFGANGHNFYCFDFNMLDPGETRKRMYFPWDADAVFKELDYDIYESGQALTTYAGLILGNPVFRAQYTQIMRDLIAGPLSEANIHAFIDDINTPELRAAIIADPWNQVGGNPAGKFAELKTWISDRIPNVLAQIEFDEPTPPPGIILLDDGFEGAVWDANWTGTWVEDTSTYCRGASSAHADKTSYGDFNCVALDTNDADAVHVDFWIQKNNISSYTAKFYYYNGTTYDEVNDIDALGADDEWIQYTDTITDSNYFIPNFQIQFSTSLSGGGPSRDVWVDDVTITKEIEGEITCDEANLDGTDPVNFKDFAILADDWLLTGTGLDGDIDANDVVNPADLDAFVNYWLSDCSLP